jgi:phenylacetate-CoA ligase
MVYEFFIEHLLLPSVGVFTASRFGREARQMRRFEKLPSDEMERRRWKSLSSLLRKAYDDVPFYRDRFREAGLHPDDIREPDDIVKLAPVTREEIVANFPDRVTAETADKRQLRLAATSGTTSQRMMVVQDFAKREAVRAASIHSFTFTGIRLGSRCMEIPPDVCTLQCGLNQEPEPSLWRYIRSLERPAWKERSTWSNLRGMVERQVVYRKVTLPSFNGDGTCQRDEALATYINQIRSRQPKALKALPTYLLALARYLVRHNLEPPRLEEIRPMGSAMAPSVRKFVHEAFGCRVVEDYGSSELGPIACECRPGSGLHLFSDLFFIEVVRGGRRVAPGEIGRLLITDLSNRTMPLIRYDIGDVGYLIPGECSCGRQTPRFVVTGRLKDTILTTQGRIVTDHTVTDLVLSHPGVDWFQLIQRSATRFELRVVGDGRTPVCRERLGANVAAAWGGDSQVTVRETQMIPPESGGKYRFIKSLSHDI